MTTDDQQYPADKLTACPICGDERFPAISPCPGCGADKTTLTEQDIATGGQPFFGENS